MHQVFEFLELIGLHQYCEALSEGGYDTFENLQYASLHDFERIGLKTGHARVLLSKLPRNLPDNLTVSKYRQLVTNLISGIVTLSTHERRCIRLARKEYQIDDITHWHVIQMAGWSQDEFEDGERILE